jgi:hypothetical protein
MARAIKKSVAPAAVAPAVLPIKSKSRASKIKLTAKLPVHPAQTGPASSTLTEQLEKLKKENTFLQEKNKALSEITEKTADHALSKCFGTRNYGVSVDH